MGAAGGGCSCVGGSSGPAGAAAGVWRECGGGSGGRQRATKVIPTAICAPHNRPSQTARAPGLGSGTSGTWRGIRSTDRMPGRRRGYVSSLRPVDRNVLGPGPLCPPTEPQVKARPTRIAGGWRGRPHPSMCHKQVPRTCCSLPRSQAPTLGCCRAGSPARRGASQGSQKHSLFRSAKNFNHGTNHATEIDTRATIANREAEESRF